jgi:hypothetical protein
VKPASVLRLAAIIDVLIAMVLVGTPFLRSRVGLPFTLLFAAVIAIGAIVLLVIASRFDR